MRYGELWFKGEEDSETTTETLKTFRINDVPNDLKSNDRIVFEFHDA